MILFYFQDIGIYQMFKRRKRRKEEDTRPVTIRAHRQERTSMGIQNNESFADEGFTKTVKD